MGGSIKLKPEVTEAIKRTQQKRASKTVDDHLQDIQAVRKQSQDALIAELSGKKPSESPMRRSFLNKLMRKGQ